MRRHIAAAGMVCVAALLPACAAPEPSTSGAAKAVPAAPTVEVRDRGGAWTADPRWTDRANELAAAAGPAVDRVAPETGLAFGAGHEPVVVFDEAAPASGDVAPRLVDGVRRPIIRVRPRALLSGEFRADTDLAPLVVEGAIRLGAAEREPPSWVVHGVALVAGGAFDTELHRRALAGDDVRSREDELFGPPASDPLAAGARVRALARCARSERAVPRYLELVFAGRQEEAALRDVGIGGATFLDAAAETERARAARALADDPLLPALRSARRSLAKGDALVADAALAPFAGRLDDASLDPWVAADARLCLAEIAVTRGEQAGAKTLVGAALATSKVVRVRTARLLEVCALPAPQRTALLQAFLADWPDAAADARAAELLKPR